MRRLFFASLLWFSALSQAQTYVGMEVCADCHQPQVAAWQRSHHAMAMQPANAQSVLAPFAGEVFTQGATEVRFFQRDGQFFINTLASDGVRQDFQVHYTFGFTPLQQYLVATDKGRLQAFDIAWDSREKSVGGQRWFHLQPEENPQPGHPFFWQGAYQNWNSRCADCHSTGVEVGFNADSVSYDTRFESVNVACESCHGPAGEHLARAKKNDWQLGSGLINSHAPAAFSYDGKAAIAKPQGSSDNSEIDMCGGCHARRSVLDRTAGSEVDFHDRFRVAGLDSELYFANGQIKDEVFVLGSFLQSKMYQAGVRCSHCHDPHSGNTLVQGDALCAQCHQPATYATKQHSRHPEGVAQCVDCHMSSRLYMGVDWRRDHGFHRPTTAVPGQTNACQGCHEDDAEVEQMRQAWSENAPHWAADLQAARDFDPRAVRALSQWIKDETQAPLVRASMLEQLAATPSQMSIDAALAVLDHRDPVLRAAAVSVLQALPASARWQALQGRLGDDSKVVRMALALALQGLPEAQFGDRRERVQALQKEYAAMLENSRDMPAAQLGLANIALQKGDLLGAQQHFETALAIDPTDMASLLNYADFNRQLGAEEMASSLLHKALAIAPDSAVVQYALGMSEVRSKRYASAINYLRAAVATDNAIPHHHYVLAVALQNQGNVRAAVDVLEAALARWPYDYALLSTAINFQLTLGDHPSLVHWVARLSEIAPNAPEVHAFISRQRQ
ncbi:MAG: hypothetical protein RL336_1684 [Pseudomonadota bacterium]